MTVSPAVVIGTGLVGASVGCALTAAGHRVHLEDRMLAHAQVAAGVGAGTTDPANPDEVALVVVAVPPAALSTVIVDALARFPQATVTDVGSVKAGVLNALWDSGADVSRYVGSHPMAGSQFSGPLTARADLFVDRTWVLAPHRKSSELSLAVVAELISICGAQAVTMDVEVHDAAVARVSHLPHLMSVLMAERLTTVPAEQLQLAGQGLRDVTRIAGSDPALWQQILGANSAALLPELRAVQDQLAELIKDLEAEYALRQAQGSSVGPEPVEGPSAGPEPVEGPSAGPEPVEGPSAGPEPGEGPSAGPEPVEGPVHALRQAQGSSRGQDNALRQAQGSSQAQDNALRQAQDIALRQAQGSSQAQDIALRQAQDNAGVRPHLERGVSGTRRIPGKHGAAPVQYRQLVVEIPDAPGALSRLFADVGDAGVNVEDVAIQHDPDRQIGYLSLSVDPDRADGLAETMRDAGWSIGESAESPDRAS